MCVFWKERGYTGLLGCVIFGKWIWRVMDGVYLTFDVRGDL